MRSEFRSHERGNLSMDKSRGLAGSPYTNSWSRQMLRKRERERERKERGHTTSGKITTLPSSYCILMVMYFVQG